MSGMTSDFLTVMYEGKRLDYDGIFTKKRNSPGPDQFLFVAAGQTVSSTFDVSAGYDVSKSGKYSVAPDTYLEYIPGSIRNINMPGKHALPTKVSHLSSLKEIFQVVGENSTRRTLGQTERSNLESNSYKMKWGRLKFPAQKDTSLDEPSAPVDPVVKGGTKAQQKAAKDAHRVAYNVVKASILDLKENQERAKTWFGIGHTGIAINVFERMEEIVKIDKITYVFGGKYCHQDTLAYTYYDTRKIILCNGYEKAEKLSGFDSKMGILTHELSHALTRTDDKVFGVSKCKKLAKRAPGRAVKNADNYEYFAESLYSSLK